MLNGEIRSKIDALWNAFWTGGISNSLEVIEQITYLLFLKRLDDLHTLEENKAARLKLKKLERENLRDHMDELEQIFSMLGEKSTTEIHKAEDSQGLPKLKSDAKAGGDIAGGARKQLEKRLRRSIITRSNFLPDKREK